MYAANATSWIVFALSGEQLTALDPAGAAAPGAPAAKIEGPALYDEASVPVAGYYG